MLRWLWNIIVGRKPCDHVWRTDQSVKVVDEMNLFIATDKELNCTKCGDWKRVRL